MTCKEFVHIDLFSGIGGFALGFQKAGLNIVEHFFSEIDKNAINIYKKHFPQAKELGDVTTIRDFSELRRSCAGKIVIITFGFPCQDLSVAGKGAGLAGARSGLFFEAIRIVKELNPQYFIFENVKGLLTNNRGADFVRCLREIADIGLYDCEWQLVNTSWFLPQNRERVYFIGHLRGKSAPKIFPFTESDFEITELQRQLANCITARYGESQSGGAYVVECELAKKTRKNSQGAMVNTIRGNSVALSALGGGGGAKTGLYVVPRGNNQGGYRNVDNCPTITKSSFETNNFICPVLTPNREEKRQNGRRFKNNGEPMFTLTTQDQHGVMIVKEATRKGFAEIPPNCGVDLTQLNSKTRRGRLMDKNCNTLTTQQSQYAWWDGVDIRRLTPLECELLQGFPDGWTEYGADGKKSSDSARYKALGNAVSVPIPELIGKRLRELNN